MKNPLSSWLAQASHNRLIALVLAMIVIVPLVASPADTRSVGFSALAFEGFALLLMTVLFWRTRWNLSREQVATFFRTGANLPIVLFAALILVSCVLSPFKGLGVQEALRFGAGILLYFVVAYQFRQSKHLSMLVDTLLFLAVAISVVAMAQFQMDPTARGTALFGNQQLLGSLLMVLLPMVGVIALNEKNSPKRQIVAQFATVLTAGCLLLAETRSAWLGALAGMTVMAVVVLWTSSRQKKSASAGQVKLTAQKHKLVLPLMLVLMTVGFFAVMHTQNSSIAARFGSISNVATDASWQERQQQWWQGAVAMVKARPVTGWGIGHFPVFQNSFTHMGDPMAGHYVSLSEQAHNLYLQTAAELGLPGLLLLVSVMGIFMVTAIRRVANMDAGIRRNMLMGSIGSVVAISIDAASSPSWQFGQISMFLWLTMGIGVSCMRPRSKHQEEEVALAPAFITRGLLRPAAALGAAAVMGLLVLPTTIATAQSFSATPQADYQSGTGTQTNNGFFVPTNGFFVPNNGFFVPNNGFNFPNGNGFNNNNNDDDDDDDDDIGDAIIYTGIGVVVLDLLSDSFNPLFGGYKAGGEVNNDSYPQPLYWTEPTG